MNLVDRVKNILLTPKTEWPVIESEQTDVKSMYLGYIMILAAIPAIASMISAMLIGSVAGRFGMGLGGALGIGYAVFGYIVALVVIYVAAFIVDALAPSFGGQKNFMNALKLVAYSATAGWVAGIAAIIPVLGWLIAFVGSLYGVYLMYLGLPVMMKNPEDKSVIYLIVTVVVYIVVNWLLMAIVGAMFFGSMMMGGMR